MAVMKISRHNHINDKLFTLVIDEGKITNLSYVYEQEKIAEDFPHKTYTIYSSEKKDVSRTKETIRDEIMPSLTVMVKTIVTKAISQTFGDS